MPSPVKSPEASDIAYIVVPRQALPAAILLNASTLPPGQTLITYNRSAFLVIGDLKTSRENSHTGLPSLSEVINTKNFGIKRRVLRDLLTGMRNDKDLRR